VLDGEAPAAPTPITDLVPDVPAVPGPEPVAEARAQATVPLESLPAPVEVAEDVPARRNVADSSIRVDVELLDSLIRLVCERVLTRNQVVRQAGDLVWRGARRGRLAGLPVVAHEYRDAAGRQVTLLRADRSFPEAVGANHPPGTAIWVAEVDGVAVLCADRPSPSLLVAPDRTEALTAASRLGLH